MVIKSEICLSCAAEIKVAVGQSIYDGKLVWYKSYSCPQCGVQREEDGEGRPPEEIRQAILEQDGEWALVVEEVSTGAIAALKTLRQALNLSLSETGEIRKRLPGIVATGTRVEMNWLLGILWAEDLRASRVSLLKDLAGPGQ